MRVSMLEYVINLQLFAEGAGGVGSASGAIGDGGNGSGETAPALPQTKGAKSNPLSNVKYGIQDEAPAVQASTVTPEDRQARFDELIKGEFKDLYDQRIQDTIKKRFKNEQAKADNYDRMSSAIDLLARKYGISPNDAGEYDIDALIQNIEDDDFYFEDEALEKGVSVEELKRARKLEKENAALKQQMQDRAVKEKSAQLYSQWVEQAKQTEQIYGSQNFNLEAQLQNPQFVDLLKAGIDVRTAYEVINKDRIIPSAMAFTAQRVEQKITNKIRSNGMRPSENGNSSQGAATIKSDVSLLTKADRQEIARRVARGEKIRF